MMTRKKGRFDSQWLFVAVLCKFCFSFLLIQSFSTKSYCSNCDQEFSLNMRSNFRVILIKIATNSSSSSFSLRGQFEQLHRKQNVKFHLELGRLLVNKRCDQFGTGKCATAAELGSKRNNFSWKWTSTFACPGLCLWEIFKLTRL